MNKRPSGGLALAAVALFVALGGTAVAVTALPKNSVGPRQLKAHAVRARALGTVVARYSEVPVPAHSSGSVSASCKPGERIVGGGGKLIGLPEQDSRLLSSRPGIGDGSAEPAQGATFDSWRVVARTDDPAGSTVRAYALCLK